MNFVHVRLRWLALNQVHEAPWGKVLVLQWCVTLNQVHEVITMYELFRCMYACGAALNLVHANNIFIALGISNIKYF